MDTAERSRTLEERYGTHRPVRRIVLIAVSALVGVVALGWLAWAIHENANPAIAGQVVSFDVQGTHQVKTTVQVQVRSSDVTGSCLLRATAVDHSIVGELTLPVDGSTPDEQVVQVRTERRATTIEVLRCTSAD